MSFLYPHVLWALLVPLLLAAAALLRRRRAGTAWRKLISPAHEAELVTRRAPWHRALGAAFALAALVAVIVAAARPICGYREAGFTTGSRNLLLALDISRSMETQDVKPSRLEEARAAAYELIEALPEDKIGLIVFSGEADLVVPLTYDHTALLDALEQVDRSWAGTGGTNFNKVLRKAMQDFSRSAPEGTNALVLLSDGEDTTDGEASVAQEAKAKNLLVLAVGIGTEAGGPIPDPEGDNGLWQDADGKHVISKLDADSLRAFAKETNGDFVVMNSQTDLAAFARRAVRRINRHEEEVSVNKVPNDRYAWPAGAALLLLLASILCATDWRLPRRATLLTSAALLGLNAAQAAPSATALEQYRMGLETMGREKEAAKGFFSEALLDEDRDLQAAALYEIGNTNTQATFNELRALYAQPEPADDDPDTPAAAPHQGPSKKALQGIVDALKKDITSYDAALKLRPALRQASANKAKVEELIRVLEEEIKREDPPSEDQQDQQNQDEQNQNNSDTQNDSDQRDNSDTQDNSDKQNDSDKQDNSDKQNDSDKQDNSDKQNDSDKQDNSDKQNDSDKQDNSDKQNDSDKQENSGQQKQDDSEQQEQPQQNQAPQEQQPQGPTEKEKAEQRAASILKMHLDEEQGSPIPHAELPARPPKKDY
ncbi:MAG: VWA domain-containing protein [Akkermansia sp.]|nr:VWA domain-containing protein [Akkermansia sp.]